MPSCLVYLIRRSIASNDSIGWLSHLVWNDHGSWLIDDVQDVDETEVDGEEEGDDDSRDIANGHRMARAPGEVAHDATGHLGGGAYEQVGAYSGYNIFPRKSHLSAVFFGYCKI